MKEISLPLPVLSKRPTSVRHLVLAALCLISTINYVQRNSLGAAETLLRDDLGISRTDIGNANGDFFLAYSLFQIPSGWLAQRWGGRRTLSLFAAGWSLMAAVTALAPNVEVLRWSRFGLGVFQAGIFPCATMILATWYPKSRRGFATAMLNSFMVIGGSVVTFLTALLIIPLGWRGLFLLYSLPGLLWAFWFFVWFRDQPRDHPRVNEAERRLLMDGDQETAQPARSKARIPWLAILLSVPLCLICIQQGCRAGTLRFFDLMLPTYLQEARQMTRHDANLWTSVMLLAGVFGGLTGGILSDWVLIRTGSRRLARQGVSIASILVALSFYCLAFFIPNAFAAVLVASIGLFIMTFSSPCAYALSMDMGGRNIAVVFGIMNMTGNLGSWAFTRYLPRVVDARGWDTALLVFAAVHIVAIVCWLCLNPNGVIGRRDEPTSDPKE